MTREGRRTEEQKFAVQRVRLLRPLTDDELAESGVFLAGNHEMRDGRSWASGSASVTAHDSAKTHAAGNSTCIARQGTTLVLTRADAGVIVDRRGTAPKTYCKHAGLDGWRFVDGEWKQSKKTSY